LFPAPFGVVRWTPKSGSSDGQRAERNGVLLRPRRYVPKQPGYGIETLQVAFFLPVFPPPFVFPVTAMIPQPPLLDAALFESTYPEELMWIPFAPFLSAWFPETGVFDPGIFDEINMPSPVLELALLLVIPASEIDGGDADIVPLVTKIPRLPLLFEVFPSISTSLIVAFTEFVPPETCIPSLPFF
jgi:hypothetical protein